MLADSLFFNPANPAVEKEKSANSHWLPRKGPRGLILAGPLSAKVLLFTPYGGRGKAELCTRKRGRHLLSKPGFVRAFSRASLPLFGGVVTSVDGLTGRRARTSAMQRKRTPHFCWNTGSKCGRRSIWWAWMRQPLSMAPRHIA